MQGFAAGWIWESIRQYYRLMAPGDEERPDPPDYNVYRSGKGGKDRGKGRSKRTSSDRSDRSRKPASGAPKGSKEAQGSGSGEPEYNLYRSSRSPLAKLKGMDLAALRGKLGEQRKQERRQEVEEAERFEAERSRPPWRRFLKWAFVLSGIWILVSIASFAISAQIQKSKLNDDAAELLGGLPLMAVQGQTILVMGTDVRPPGVPDESGQPTKKKCTEAAGVGDVHPDDCLPTRADTLLLVRAGGGAFEKLSIPRDTRANIPGVGPDKINAAYAFGGAALQIETVENFLGVEIDHAVIVDFDGFEDLIDSIGGVKVRLTDRFKSKVGGGAGQGGITLELDRGEHVLDGQNALVYARTRKNLKDLSENDIDRARRQQQVLDGIKSRLTSVTRLPYNFFKGPFIAWSAPKAMVSDMGGFTLPQLAFSAAIGGNSSTTILGRKNTTIFGDQVIVGLDECQRAVRKFLGESGPDTPECSPP